MTNFAEEKGVQQKIELDCLKADQLLVAVAKLECQMDDINNLNVAQDYQAVVFKF